MASSQEGAIDDGRLGVRGASEAAGIGGEREGFEVVGDRAGGSLGFALVEGGRGSRRSGGDECGRREGGRGRDEDGLGSGFCLLASYDIHEHPTFDDFFDCLLRVSWFCSEVKEEDDELGRRSDLGFVPRLARNFEDVRVTPP